MGWGLKGTGGQAHISGFPLLEYTVLKRILGGSAQNALLLTPAIFASHRIASHRQRYSIKARTFKQFKCHVAYTPFMVDSKDLEFLKASRGRTFPRKQRSALSARRPDSVQCLGCMSSAWGG